MTSAQTQVERNREGTPAEAPPGGGARASSRPGGTISEEAQSVPPAPRAPAHSAAPAPQKTTRRPAAENKKEERTRAVTQTHPQNTAVKTKSKPSPVRLTTNHVSATRWLFLTFRQICFKAVQ